MKKIVTLVTLFLGVLSVAPVFSFAADTNLISNVQISLKSTENPKRLEVRFHLGEPIDLAGESANIIFEYLAQDSNGNLQPIPYQKDKTWSGYLNSYENYPSGEHKYSSGAQNGAYSDKVPAATIYTSAKTGASIDVTLVAAVRITVLRADSSGESVIIYSNGTMSAIEKIEVPVVDKDKNTGITLHSTTAELPADTTLVADELTSGPVYETVTTALADIKDFVVFKITLESDGKEIQPADKVKISIPIPEKFNNSDIAIYKINTDGTKIPYPLTITTNEEASYATFETEHFSIYALAEVEIGRIENPKTGESSNMYFMAAFTIISAIGIIMPYKKAKAV